MKRPILINDLYQKGDPNEVTDIAIAKALGRPTEYREGIFNVKIWGGDVHPTKDWVAWIDFYHDIESKGWVKDNYHLRIQVDDQITLDWEVETYNPFFGAYTLYIHWHDDKLVYIYSEKHRYYGVMATTSEIKKRVELGVVGSYIQVDDNIVRVSNWKKAYDGTIDQYQLPDWTPLDPLPEAKAREMSLLEDNPE